MPGIYVHIPFCKQACHYCDFHFSTSQSTRTEMIPALAKEIVLRKNYLADKNIQTVYFGGGTPGLLGEEELTELTKTVFLNFVMQPDAEITLETNPDDVDAEKLQLWKTTGINRLSIGIQSFNDNYLQWMNRAHDTQQAIRSVKMAQDAGFDNITIDLIYGIPGMNEKEWEKNLDTAFSMNVPHISSYCLTVEKGTALHHFVEKGQSMPIDEETAARQFLLMQEKMEENGFIAYEISNYGKKNYFSRHNTSYWEGESYLGVGPSAHSFNGVSRQWNISHNRKYITALKEGKSFYETEILTPANRYNEYIMTSLRTIRGINTGKTGEMMPGSKQATEDAIRQMEKKGWMIKNGEGNYVLTPQGKLFADKIASDFFLL
ncbi:MAG: radical SAM family heme chaperone HemW [Bacteroidota bacterium]